MKAAGGEKKKEAAKNREFTERGKSRKLKCGVQWVNEVMWDLIAGIMIYNER